MARQKSSARGVPPSSNIKSAKNKAANNKQTITASTKIQQGSNLKPAGKSEATKEGATTGTEEQSSAALAVTTTATTPYSRALSRLGPMQPVLTGIAHRNHNQHRRAAWWRYFQMLRRHCGKYMEELISTDVAAEEEAAKAARVAKARSKKRRREMLVSGLGGGEKGVDEEEEARKGLEVGANATKYAVWLRDVLVPKCYLAFSQLTADNQFAPLGVVLLGVLASVQTACNDIAPRPLTDDPSCLSAPDATVSNTSPLPPTADDRLDAGTRDSSQAGDQGAREEDKGRAISREALERVEKKLSQSGKGERGDKTKSSNSQTKQAQDATRPTPPIPSLAVATVTATSTSTKGSKAVATATTSSSSNPSKAEQRVTPAQDEKDDNETVRPPKRVKTAASRVAVAPKPTNEGDTNNNNDNNSKNEKDNKKGRMIKKEKKKKKAKKGGDEFDDLFKGLF